MTSAVPVLTPAEATAWDARAAASGIELATLMESAGRAVAAVMAARVGPLLHRGVLIAAGPGNNGGDGWVAARALHRLGVPVWVAPVSPQPGPRGDHSHGPLPAGNDGSPLARRMAELARAEGVREVPPDGPWPSVALVVDALLGTGAKGPPRAPMAALLGRLHDLAVPVVAIDGPTGVDLLTGVIHAAPRADLTVTFGGLRRGHLLARDEVGDVVVADIGHPLPDPSWASLVTDEDAASWLRRLHAGDHKGDRGRVVIVGGDAGMTGAIRLCARAAFAAGAGLVHAVAPAATVAALVEAEPDLQTLAHDFTGAPSEALIALVESADALVVGPGLGRAPGRADFVSALVEASRAAVLDADAINAFQGAVERLRALGAGRPLVLTPHPGEFRGLFPLLAAGRELDPWAAAAAAAEMAGCTMLLKGVPTVVASPVLTPVGSPAVPAAAPAPIAGPGASPVISSPLPPLTIAAGNPGLATGGSGDVLSGLIGTALAQRLDVVRAGALGAQALGRAADLAARKISPRALRPMDVIAALPELWREWDHLAQEPPPARPPVLYELARPATV